MSKAKNGYVYVQSAVNAIWLRMATGFGIL